MQLLSSVKDKAAQFASENATVLLTAGGVVGVVGSVVLTARAAFQAADKIDVARMTSLAEELNVDVTELTYAESRHHDLDTKDKVKLAAPYFIPPIVTSSATIFAIIMSHRMSAQKAAALAAAYGLAERNFGDYKAKVEEKLTGQKATQINDELAQEKVDRTPGHDNIVVLDGEVLCLDLATDRYFRSTVENIKQAVNTTNAEINNHGLASASFFYKELGLKGTAWSDEVGFDMSNLVELTYSTAMAGNKPCFTFEFKTLPKVEYGPQYMDYDPK